MTEYLLLAERSIGWLSFAIIVFSFGISYYYRNRRRMQRLWRNNRPVAVVVKKLSQALEPIISGVKILSDGITLIPPFIIGVAIGSVGKFFRGIYNSWRVGVRDGFASSKE